MKIVGIEGLPPERIRNEVASGAKFVVYSYNFSFVVMSFKRPSNIYYIAPGGNRIIKGLPFTLISLLVGWWGIPWGLIYTLQSLGTNLSGGKDVTQSVMASMAARPAGGAPPTQAPPLGPSARPAGRLSPAQWLPAAGVVAALTLIVYAVVCFMVGQNLQVALVSGLKSPYAVQLDGRAYHLSGDRAQLLTLPEGRHVLAGAPGHPADQTFTAATRFFARPFDRHVLVINPDRAALVVQETVRYHAKGATPDPNERGSWTLYANEREYYIPSPDYFFSTFPTTISVSAGSSGVKKSRVGALAGFPLQTRASLVSRKLGYDALRRYFSNLADIDANDEVLERLIYVLLKPDDARRLFESHLADRPVRVEWHRAYQSLMDLRFPSVDVASRYLAWSKSEPDDGALQYLYARLLTDPKKARPVYAKALDAKHPCSYAAFGLSVDAFAAGDFNGALGWIRRAEAGGLHSDSLTLRKRETLLALGRVADAAENARRAESAQPTDVAGFADQLMLSETEHADRAAGQRAVGGFLSAFRAKFGVKDTSATEHYLDGCLAYALNDEAGASGYFAMNRSPAQQFECAIDRRDYAAAAKVTNAQPDADGQVHLILMLAAHAAGNEGAAKAYFDQAVSAMAHSDSYSRMIAMALSGGKPVDHAMILRSPNWGSELRVLFTALGVHFPDQRRAYFARAEALNRDPAFPHLLLQSVLRRQ